MEIKEKKPFRVVEGYKGSVKKKIEYYKERFEKKSLKQRMKEKVLGKNFMITLVVLVIGIGLFLFVNLKMHTSVSVTDTYNIAGAADSSYEKFAGGILKYTRDGISYLNMEGEEQWNLPYQIKTPFVEKNDVSAAVACRGGNDILVFQKEGKVGEIKTTLPIEKLTLSEQGIVCAILKNDDSPKVICYDTAGNILVEHNVSLSGMGYPMDVSISADGEVLQVLYLYVHDGKLTSKVAYYHFGKEGETVKDHQIAYKEYENTIVVSGFYMDNRTSVVMGDNCMTIFEGADKVEEAETIMFDKEIQSVSYSDKYIALLFANAGESGYELRLYNKTGKQIMSENLNSNIKNIEIAGNQILLYDGKECAIFLKNGIRKFEGQMHNNIMEIIPVSGVNKYAVMNANGIEYVRLTNERK